MDCDRILRYEEEEYFGASFSKLLEIADILAIDTAQGFGDLAHENNDGKIWRSSEDFNWSKFPVDEAEKRGWIENGPTESSIDRFKAWFRDAAGPYANFVYYRRNKTHQDWSVNEMSCEASLFAWQARVKQLAEAEIKKSPVNEFELNERWLKDLAHQTVYNDGPLQAIESLRENGIVVIIERHLPKTYLDGAAMLSHDGIPIVALTLRYDRLDYFWFTLFHELGHVYCHLFDHANLNFSYFDEKFPANSRARIAGNVFSGDEREVQANNFALEKLIPTESWDACLSRFAVSSEAVISDAERLGVHPSIVAGRIRYERKNYTLLNKMVGQGELRKLFKYYPS